MMVDDRLVAAIPDDFGSAVVALFLHFVGLGFKGYGFLPALWAYRV